MIPAAYLLLFLLSAASHQTDTRVVLTPTRYDIDFELDYASERLRASVLTVVVNHSAQPVRRASFMLYRLLRVRTARDDKGRPLAFSQSVVAFDDDEKWQVNQVLVTLAQPLAPGGRASVRLDYGGYVLGYAETGWRYVKDRIDPEFTILREETYPYPTPGYPSRSLMRRHVTAWEFDYSARITVPKDLTVANGGRLEGTDLRGESASFRYSSLKSSWRMDFAIAKYGSLSSDAVHVFYLPGDKEGAAGVMEAATKSLDLYTRWFGPRPRSSALTFIEIPDGFGSQADVTTIMQTAGAFRDVKQHREVYHEISHLWNVNDIDQAPPRWNEGLASFLEFLVDQEVTGEPRVDARATRLLDWLRAQLPSHPTWRSTPLADYGRAGLTDLSYSVGAMFFDLLHRLVGRDRFNAIIHEYTTRFAGGGTTKDLVDVVRATHQVGITQLIGDWIITTGWVQRIEHGATIADLEAYYRNSTDK